MPMHSSNLLGCQPTMHQALQLVASSSQEAGSTKHITLVGRGIRYGDGTSLFLCSELPPPNVCICPLPVPS